MNVCDAILEFENTSHFVMCEKNKGHTGNHRGLFFEWQGDGIQKTHSSWLFRGKAILKIELDKLRKKQINLTK